jgi:hypothetical protein
LGHKPSTFFKAWGNSYKSSLQIYNRFLIDFDELLFKLYKLQNASVKQGGGKWMIISILHNVLQIVKLY